MKRTESFIALPRLLKRHILRKDIYYTKPISYFFDCVSRSSHPEQPLYRLSCILLQRDVNSHYGIADQGVYYSIALHVS